jgi:hypothetical protein
MLQVNSNTTPCALDSFRFAFIQSLIKSPATSGGPIFGRAGLALVLRLSEYEKSNQLAVASLGIPVEISEFSYF